MVRRPALIASLASAAVLLVAGPALGAPVYKSPGFKGSTKAPPTVPPPPPPQTALTDNGTYPDAVVDGAGTAHIVWNDPRGDDADGVGYCRLQRAATACDKTDLLVPPKNYGPGDSPQFNTDDDGPKILLIGDQLVILSYRYPTAYDKPDGGGVSRSVLEWTSEDGGTTWTGPGLVGNNDINGGIVTYGDPGAPQIATIGQQGFCGSCVQRIKPGKYEGGAADLAAEYQDARYSGSLAVDGGLPVAAFADLSNQTWVRKWTGAEPFNDPGTWTPASPIPGDSPDIAGGPAGTYLMNQPADGKPFVLSRLDFSSGAVAAGPSAPITDGDAPRYNRITEDPSGRLQAAWVSTAGSTPGVKLRSGAPGALSSPLLVLPGADQSQINVAATGDGGGFVVANTSTGSPVDPGKLVAVGFGPRTPTKVPGAGLLPGGGDTSASSSCQDITFGAVSVSQEGGLSCFLHGTGQFSKVSVTEGTINLNGLKIIPDADVKIVLDPRNHKLWTTGSVRVVAEGLGLSLTLWHGELRIDLPDAGVSKTLFSFDTSQFPVDMFGFGLKGKIDVILQKDSVKIPVSVQLPPPLDVIRGDTTLIVDKTGGLHLDSLHIQMNNVPLGPLLIDQIDVSYTGSTEIWMGAIKMHFPPPGVGGALDGSVTFEKGDFKEATLAYTPPTPGIVIGPSVYLLRIDGVFGLRPTHIGAGARIGVGAAVNGVSPVSVDGHFDMTFPDNGPATFKMTGGLNLFVLHVADAHAEFVTDGYVGFGGSMDIDLKVISLKGGVDGFADTSGQFGTSGNIDVCVDLKVGPISLPCLGSDFAANNQGGAVCVRASIAGKKVSGGLELPWRDLGPEDFVNPAVLTVTLASHLHIPCATDAYRSPPRPAARAAQTGVITVPVKGGLPTETIAVFGQDAPPPVAVRGPGGQGATTVFTSDSAKATYIELDKPAAGTWTISTTDGSPIINQLQSDGYTEASVSGSLGRSGAARTIAYKTSNLNNGQSIQFLETGRFGSRVIKTVTASSGTVRFRPAAVRGGTRKVIAQVLHDGMVTSKKTIGSFVAPSPKRVARPRGVRVKGATVSWTSVAGAKRYVVRISSTHGKRSIRFLPANARTLRVAGLAPGDVITATVGGIGADGRAGPTTKSAVVKPKKKKKSSLRA